MFIRYLEGVKGYTLWYLEDEHMQCIICRDVMFNESRITYKISLNTNKGRLDLTPEKEKK